MKTQHAPSRYLNLQRQYIYKQTEKHSQIHLHFKGPHTTGITKINNIG
jgi:hypothetical protein